MTPTIRVKFGLFVIASVVLSTFAWSAAQGQIRPPIVRPPRLRPPVPPAPIGPRINPPGMPGGGVTQTVWSCPKCNYQYRGAVPPSTCPGCQTRMMNGVGNGIPGPGGRVNPNPGMNPGGNLPGMNPPGVNPNPPGMNPNPVGTPVPPVNNQPKLDPVNNLNPVGEISPVASSSDSSSSTSSSSSASEPKSSRKWVVPVVIGIIVLGVFVLLGGTFLVIYSVRSSGSSSSNRRRRRRVDYDD